MHPQHKSVHPLLSKFPVQCHTSPHYDMWRQLLGRILQSRTQNSSRISWHDANVQNSLTCNGSSLVVQYVASGKRLVFLFPLIHKYSPRRYNLRSIVLCYLVMEAWCTTVVQLDCNKTLRSVFVHVLVEFFLSERLPPFYCRFLVEHYTSLAFLGTDDSQEHA